MSQSQSLCVYFETANSSNQDWSDSSKVPNFAPITDSRPGVMSGGCQCNGVKYELLAIPREIQHCYCSICRKIGGTQYQSWSPLRESDVRFVSNHTLNHYKSSKKVLRGFCGKCGGKIYLKYQYQRNLIWLTTALFDEHKNWHRNKRKMHIYCDSKAAYTMIPIDGNKRLKG